MLFRSIAFTNRVNNTASVSHTASHTTNTQHTPSAHTHQPTEQAHTHHHVQSLTHHTPHPLLTPNDFPPLPTPPPPGAVAIVCQLINAVVANPSALIVIVVVAHIVLSSLSAWSLILGQPHATSITVGATLSAWLPAWVGGNGGDTIDTTGHPFVVYMGILGIVSVSAAAGLFNCVAVCCTVTANCWAHVMTTWRASSLPASSPHTSSDRKSVV